MHAQMGSLAELSLGRRPSTGRDLESSLLHGSSRDRAVPGGLPIQRQRIDTIKRHLKSLEDELRKIEVFKRELPICMQLLTDAIQISKEKLSEWRKRGATYKTTSRHHQQCPSEPLAADSAAHDRRTKFDNNSRDCGAEGAAAAGIMKQGLNSNYSKPSTIRTSELDLTPDSRMSSCTVDIPCRVDGSGGRRTTFWTAAEAFAKGEEILSTIMTTRTAAQPQKKRRHIQQSSTCACAAAAEDIDINHNDDAQHEESVLRFQSVGNNNVNVNASMNRNVVDLRSSSRPRGAFSPFPAALNVAKETSCCNHVDVNAKAAAEYASFTDVVVVDGDHLPQQNMKKKKNAGRSPASSGGVDTNPPPPSSTSAISYASTQHEDDDNNNNNEFERMDYHEEENDNPHAAAAANLARSHTSGACTTDDDNNNKNVDLVDCLAADIELSSMGNHVAAGASFMEAEHEQFRMLSGGTHYASCSKNAVAPYYSGGGCGHGGATTSVAITAAHAPLPSSASSSRRKQRRCWSPDLHRKFLTALQQLGGSDAATPKLIRELMGVDGLTNDEVKSHLQKYRLHTRRPADGIGASASASASASAAAEERRRAGPRQLQAVNVVLDGVGMPRRSGGVSTSFAPAAAAADGRDDEEDCDPSDPECMNINMRNDQEEHESMAAQENWRPIRPQFSTEVAAAARSTWQLQHMQNAEEAELEEEDHPNNNNNNNNNSSSSNYNNNNNNSSSSNYDDDDDDDDDHYHNNWRRNCMNVLAVNGGRGLLGHMHHPLFNTSSSSRCTSNSRVFAGKPLAFCISQNN